MEHRQALVIGGSGFVGRALVPALLSHGYEVTLLNRGTRSVEGTAQLVADRLEMSQMLSAGRETGSFDLVIDTCAYAARATEIAWEVFSAKCRHWIQLSSAAVYRETPGRDPRESDHIGGAPVWGDYGVDKSACDDFLLARANPTSVTILRPPYLYGPGNDNDRETFVWSRALQGAPILIPTDGSTRIQFLHVEDLATAIIACANHRPERSAVYNVAAPERPSLIEWVNLMCEIAQCKNVGIPTGPNARSYTPRQYFPFRDYPCCVEEGRITEEIGWRPRHDLRGGFASTYESSNRDDLRMRPIGSDVERAIFSTIQMNRSRGMSHG
jgi:nucleoside-diphosphate-sugar epimerase